MRIERRAKGQVVVLNDDGNILYVFNSNVILFVNPHEPDIIYIKDSSDYSTNAIGVNFNDVTHTKVLDNETAFTGSRDDLMKLLELSIFYQANNHLIGRATKTYDNIASRNADITNISEEELVFIKDASGDTEHTISAGGWGYYMKKSPVGVTDPDKMFILIQSLDHYQSAGHATDGLSKDLEATKIYIGDSSNKAKPKALTGDVTVDENAVTKISDNVVKLSNLNKDNAKNGYLIKYNGSEWGYVDDVGHILDHTTDFYEWRKHIVVGGGGDKSILIQRGKEKYSLLTEYGVADGKTIATNKDITIDEFELKFIDSNKKFTLEYLIYLNSSDFTKAEANGNAIKIKNDDDSNLIQLQAQFKPYAGLAQTISASNITYRVYNDKLIVRFNVKVNRTTNIDAFNDEIQLVRTGTNNYALVPDNFGLSIKQYKGLVNTTSQGLYSDLLLGLIEQQINTGIRVYDTQLAMDNDKGVLTNGELVILKGVGVYQYDKINDSFNTIMLKTINASELTSGTLNNARLDQNILYIDGGNLKELDGGDPSNIIAYNMLKDGSIRTLAIQDKAVTFGKLADNITNKVYFNDTSWRYKDENTAPAEILNLRKGDLLRWNNNIYLIMTDGAKDPAVTNYKYKAPNRYSSISKLLSVFVPLHRHYNTSYSNGRQYAPLEIVKYNDIWWECIAETTNYPPRLGGDNKWRHYSSEFGDRVLLDGGKLKSISGHGLTHNNNIVSYDSGKIYDKDGNEIPLGATAAQLDGKVDKVTGKQLSTNDYTTPEKNKLAGIQAGAQVNPTIDTTLSRTSTNALQNKEITKEIDALMNINHPHEESFLNWRYRVGQYDDSNSQFHLWNRLGVNGLTLLNEYGSNVKLEGDDKIYWQALNSGYESGNKATLEIIIRNHKNRVDNALLLASGAVKLRLRLATQIELRAYTKKNVDSAGSVGGATLNTLAGGYFKSEIIGDYHYTRMAVVYNKSKCRCYE